MKQPIYLYRASKMDKPRVLCDLNSHLCIEVTQSAALRNKINENSLFAILQVI